MGWEGVAGAHRINRRGWLVLDVREGYSSGVTAGGSRWSTTANPGNLDEWLTKPCWASHSCVTSYRKWPWSTMFGASTATPALLMPAADSRVLVPRHRSPRMPWMDALGGSLPALRRGSALSNGGGGGGLGARDRGGRPDEVLVEDHCGRAAERRISWRGLGRRGIHSGPGGHALMMPPDPSRFRVWPPEGLDRKPRKHESGRLGNSLRLSGVAPDAARWKWTTVLRRRRQQRPRRRRPRRGGCGQRHRRHRGHWRPVGAAPAARGSLRQCRTAAESEVPRKGRGRRRKTHLAGRS